MEVGNNYIANVFKANKMKYLLFVILFASCVSEKKAIEKAKVKLISSGELAKICADTYPATVKPGTTQVSIDSSEIQYRTETKYITVKDTVFASDTIIRYKQINKTSFIHDTIVDNAALSACRQDWNNSVTANKNLTEEILKNRTQYEEEKSKIKKQRNVFAIALGAAAIAIFLLFRIKIFKI